MICGISVFLVLDLLVLGVRLCGEGLPAREWLPNFVLCIFMIAGGMGLGFVLSAKRNHDETPLAGEDEAVSDEPETSITEDGISQPKEDGE